MLSEASRYSEPTSFLEFHPDHVAGVRTLLGWLLTQSPLGSLIFTSDWQFGPKTETRFDALSLQEFWRLHDRRMLRLNSLYPIARAA